MPEPSVSARVARVLFDFAAARGADAKELARRSGIDAAELERSDDRVPFARYVALMRAARDLCGDPALALHFGEQVRLSELSLLPLLGSSTGAMEDDIASLNRYGRLDADVGGAERFHLSRIDGRLWLIDDRPAPNDFPEHTESFFARAVTEIRRFFGDVPFVEAVHMTHAEPPYRAEYDRIFRVPLYFGSERNALVFAAAAWPTDTSESGGYAAALVRAHADSLLEKLESEDSMRGRVERLLVPLLRTGQANVERIAAELGLSRQTLFRKLRGEGVTFEKTLDELRYKIAEHYLSAKSHTVNEIAYLLGFSDAAAFSRAFKRWTGRNPGRRRR